MSPAPVCGRTYGSTGRSSVQTADPCARSWGHGATKPVPARGRRRVLLRAALAAPGAEAAPCGTPGNNEIVEENCLPGSPASEWDVVGRRRRGHPGLRDRHQRPAGRDGRASRSTPTPRTTGSTSTGWATTAATARGTSRRSSRRSRCRRTSRRAPIRRRPAWSTAATGPQSASWNVPGHRHVGHLLRQARARERRRRRQPRHVHRPRRRRRLRPAVPDVGHDLAGLQHLRREQPLRGQPGRAAPTRSPTTARSSPAATRPRTGSSTPSTRWSAGSSATATTSATPPASTATACRPSCSSTSSFLSVGHDEYWSGTQRANVEAARDAGREPRLLQRQRGVLEDPLGEQPPHARHLQGDARERQDRPRGEHLDRHLARPAPVQPAGRPAGERADGHRCSPSTRASAALRVPADDGKLRLWRNTPVASQLPGGVADADRRHRSATSGTRTSTTGRGPAGLVRLSSTTVERRRQAAGLRLDLRVRHGDAPPHALPRRERRRARTRWCSARARSSGRGGSTPSTTAAARRPMPRCSRRP